MSAGNGKGGPPRLPPKRKGEVERGKFVEVRLPYSDKDKRKRWVRGHVLGVGPAIAVDRGKEHAVKPGTLLVKLAHGHAMADTLHVVDRQHDEWRLLFP